jgi:hypothetical protein
MKETVTLMLYKSCSISTHCFFVHRFSILLFPVVDSLVQILPAAGLGLASEDKGRSLISPL